MLVMALPDPHYTIRTKIFSKAVLVTSLAQCPRRYGANTKTGILVGTVLEVKVGPKEITLGSRRSYVITKPNLGGGDVKLVTINLRSVNIHTMEPLCPATNDNGGQRSDDVTTTTTKDTIITDPVSIRVFKAPAPDPLNYKALKVVVSQPIYETPIRLFSPLKKDDRSVIGAVIAHVMDASTVEMPPHPPLPQFLPLLQFILVPLTLISLPPILALCASSPH